MFDMILENPIVQVGVLLIAIGSIVSLIGKIRGE